MNVSAWSIRNPIAAVMLFVLLTLAGAMSFKAMKIQNFPDLELPTVTVTATLPGAAPAQMETEVARKIENAVATLQGVKHIYGKVQDGTATITVEFRLEKPTQEAVDDVRDAVSRVRADLPADMRDPQVSKMNLSGAPILTYTIEAPRMDAEALSWFVDNDITKALLSINGVGSVARVGGVTREVQVNIDPARLLALGATVADVSRQLRAVQQDASGGRTDWAGGEQTVRTIATVQSAAELAQLDIPLQGGRRAKLADLATVTDTVAEQRSVALLDGKPVVGFEITRSRGASEVEVDAGVSRVLAELKTAHPGENYGLTRNEVERVPAADIYHLFTPERAEQVRGITWFHAIIVRGSVIHRFEEAAVIAAEIGASKVAALERSEEAADVIGAGMADGISGGLPQIKVEAGEMFELPPGYKLNSWNPDYPHANFESFLKACLRGLAAGLDVAAHNLTGDMTEVNYSSARIAELSEREMWMTLQDWLITSFVQPLYEDWLALNLLSGNITFPLSGKAIPADRFDKFRRASRFQGRRWAWVDPAKEADANAKLLETGLTSRTRLAAEQGEEFEDILDELAQEKVLMQAAGVTTAPAAPPPPDDPEEAPEVLAAKALAAGQVRVAELNRDAAVLLKPAPPPANVINVTTPPVRNEITVQPAAAPAVTVTNEINEREQATPVINFNPTTNVAAPEVTVEVDAIMPAVSEVAITAMPIRKTTTEILRDQAGDIATSVQVESDA